MITKDLRQKVLSLAIRGKLVEQDSNDEPAVALLKRVNPAAKPITEDVPFDVPQGWCWVRLGDVCLFENGFAFKSQDYKNEGTPIIRISDIVNNRVELSKCVYYQGTVDKRFCISKGDLLIALSGATTGKMGVYMCDKKAYLNQRVGNLKIKYTNVLSYEYRNIYMQSLVDKILYNAYGAAQPNISGNTICKMLIPLPPLAEQQRIVSKLEELLGCIDTIERAQEDLNNIRKWLRSKLLSLAISGKLVPQDPNEEPAITLLKRIDPYFTPQQYDENLPQGWCACQLKDCGVTVLNGYAFKSNEYTTKGVRVIRITNVQDGLIVDNEPKYYPLDNEEVHKYYLREGDLLMSLTGNVGRVGWMPANLLPAALNQRVGCLRFNNKSISKQYLFYFLQSDLFRKDCVNSGKGIAQLNISTEWLKRYILPLPPLAEQERIVKKLEELFGVLDNL